MAPIPARVFPALALSLAIGLPAWSGVIKGRVTDPDGNPVPEVRITLSDAGLEKSYVLSTDAKGRYRKEGIAPAEYAMRLEKEGYVPLDGNVIIAPGAAIVRNAVLAPASEKPAGPAWRAEDAAAKRLYKAGRYVEALDLYEGILSRYRELARIHFYAGNCRFHLERYEEALAAYKEAVRLKPDFFEAYTNLANASSRLDRLNEDLPLIEKALALYPESSELLSTAGRIYLVIGRSELAAACLEKAASLAPDARSDFYSLGLARARQGDLAGAVRAYEKFISLNADAGENARVRKIVDRLKAQQMK